MPNLAAMGTELEEVRERLRSIADELSDLALDRLREAVRGADQDPAAEERRITRARRAVDKAIAVLAEGDPVE